jgi:hypothetical protein
MWLIALALALAIVVLIESSPVSASSHPPPRNVAGSLSPDTGKPVKSILHGR